MNKENLEFMLASFAMAAIVAILVLLGIAIVKGLCP